MVVLQQRKARDGKDLLPSSSTSGSSTSSSSTSRSSTSSSSRSSSTSSSPPPPPAAPAAAAAHQHQRQQKLLLPPPPLPLVSCPPLPPTPPPPSSSSASPPSASHSQPGSRADKSQQQNEGNRAHPGRPVWQPDRSQGKPPKSPRIGSKPFFLHRVLLSELQVVCSVWGPLDLPVGETGTVLVPQGGARRAGGRFEI